MIMMLCGKWTPEEELSMAVLGGRFLIINSITIRRGRWACEQFALSNWPFQLHGWPGKYRDLQFYMMRPTHSEIQSFSKKYFLENPIWRIVVFLLANFTCQLKVPGRGQGCLCGLFDSPCCWEGGGGRRVGLTKELNREKNWKLKCSELKRRRLGKGSCAEKEALSVLGIRRRWRSPQIHRRCSPEIHWRCSPQIRWRAPGQYWAPGVGTGLNGLVTIELEGIVTVHCDENQSPEILRDQMISVVATIIWIVFKLQAAIA